MWPSHGGGDEHRPDDGLVKVIGTIGICPVLGFFLVARDPVRNRDFLVAVLVLNVALAATYVYLIGRGLFPTGEYVNVTLLVVGTAGLAALYPWRAAGPTDRPRRGTTRVRPG